RSKDIMVGPGRGSAAGSIVSYVLAITNIEPTQYQLLFERFLNPERVSMPDIDIDFCYERRQEVIEYVVEKYGKDRVAQIVTFGTLAARGVIRDVGRVMDLPYAFCDTISKSIPMELKMTIDKALQMNPDLKKMYETDESVTKLIDMARRLEGLPRHTSMHAAGVLICQQSADEYVPLSRASDGTITTQYTMTTLEELGLLKMDFLGLRTLTVIQNAVRNIEKSQHVKIDVEQIDFHDKAVLDYIGLGKTEGIFQLESAGMSNFMKELRPSSLEDLIAGISLYRPGPMDFIPAYIKGKQNPSQVTYKCKELEPILAPTYGCIVYQEQVMQIVRDLAGYTLGRSDMVRRAMSKKKASVMEKERKNFVFGNEEEHVPGCVSKGVDPLIANQIFDEMTDFANYAFNKSHAAGYAVIAYQTAWLKYYYPVEYMAANMSSVMDKTSKIAEYIFSCRKMGIEVLSPDVNEGEGGFSVSDGKIRYGLSAIKGVGRPVIESLVKEREENGPFTSMRDFVERLTNKDLNKRAVENFIKSGAFDGLGATRKQSMLIYPMVIDHVSQNKKNALSGQISLFDFVPEEQKQEFDIQMPDVGEYDLETFLSLEKEVLGVYITGHPLQEYEERWKKNITAVSTDFLFDEEEKKTRVEDGSQVVIGGMIVGKTIKYTKNNKVMAFLTIEDLVGTVEVIVFPKDYERYQNLMEADAKIFIKGRINAEDEKDGKLICEQIFRFDDATREIWLQFQAIQNYEDQQEELFKLLAESDGEEEVVIYIADEKAVKRLPKSRTISFDRETASKLYKFLGESNVKVVEKSIAKLSKNY
nr:DNA polymerase III subunit alpha [Lachnospiraceae bacterium]